MLQRIYCDSKIRIVVMIIFDGRHTLTDVDRSTENRKILQEWRANIIALADVGCWSAGFHVSMEFMNCLIKRKQMALVMGLSRDLCKKNE